MYFSKQQRQIFVLYFSTGLGVVVGILSSVLNTRYLLPEFYGNVRYVQNVIAFVSSLLLVGFFQSGCRLLALSDNDLYRRRIRGGMCTILAVIIVIVMLTMLSLFIFNNIFDTHSGITTLYLVAVPFCGTTLMLNYINTTGQGDNHIGRIAIAQVVPSSLYVIIAYYIYTRYEVSQELVLFLSNGVAFVTLFTIIWSTKPLFKYLKETFAILKEENRHYGFNVYLGSLADNATRYISGITLGLFCENNASVGFYILSQTMSAPLAMLPASIGTTYFRRFATDNKIAKKILFCTFLLTLFSCMIFIVLIKYIVLFLYNEKYESVSTYASWLAVASSAHGFGDMFYRFLSAHGLGRQLRNSSFACGGVLFIGSIVLVCLFKISGAIATNLFSSVVYLLMLVYYYFMFIKSKESKEIKI